MSTEGVPPEFKGLPPAHPVQMRSTALPSVFKGTAGWFVGVAAVRDGAKWPIVTLCIHPIYGDNQRVR